VIIVVILGMFANLIPSTILLNLGMILFIGLIAYLSAQFLNLFAYSKYKIDDSILKAN